MRVTALELLTVSNDEVEEVVSAPDGVMDMSTDRGSTAAAGWIFGSTVPATEPAAVAASVVVEVTGTFLRFVVVGRLVFLTAMLMSICIYTSQLGRSSLVPGVYSLVLSSCSCRL